MSTCSCGLAVTRDLFKPRLTCRFYGMVIRAVKEKRLEEWIVLSGVLFRVAEPTEPGLDQHERASERTRFFPSERYPSDLSLTPCSTVIRTTAAIVLMTLDRTRMNILYQYLIIFHFDKLLR